jgi:hypothetical protein
MAFKSTHGQSDEKTDCSKMDFTVKFLIELLLKMINQIIDAAHIGHTKRLLQEAIWEGFHRGKNG